MQYLTIDRNSAAVRNVLTPALHLEHANRLISVTREDEIFGKNIVDVVGDPYKRAHCLANQRLSYKCNRCAIL